MTDLDKAVSWAQSFAASPLTTIAEAEALTLILTALSAQSAELAKAREALNTPEVEKFAEAVVAEAQHQRYRWGTADDAGKTPFDWFWLIGYLAQKAAASAVAGDVEKAKHHTISTAAALANWHAFISGEHSAFRPGIAGPEIRA